MMCDTFQKFLGASSGIVGYLFVEAEKNSILGFARLRFMYDIHVPIRPVVSALKMNSFV